MTAVLLAGCGTTSGQSSSGRHAASVASGGSPTRPSLVLARRSFANLAAPVQDAASVTAGNHIVVMGGLSASDQSTDGVTDVSVTGGGARRLAPLPQPVHDGAAAPVANTVTLFGGGQSSGTSDIVRVIPQPPSVVSALPQPLSDAAAVAIGSSAYIVGGWNGQATNRAVYHYVRGQPPTVVGRLSTGVRYPAVGALDGKILIAGGQTPAGPTADVWSFDTATHRSALVTRLPHPLDHGAGVVAGGRFYVIGGLRNGRPTAQILSWKFGERHPIPTGKLPEPLSDLSAVAVPGGVATVGGRGPRGPVATVSLFHVQSAQ